MGAHLDGDVQPLLGFKAPPEIVWGGAQAALFYDLAAFGVDEAQIAVLVAEVHSSRHLHLLPATITRGPILLCGPLKEPVDYLQTLPQGTARRIGLLISSKVELQGVVSEIRWMY